MAPCSYRMRCEHFPLLHNSIIRAQSESKSESDSFVGGLSTTSSSPIGSLYKKSAQYSYEDRVFVTGYH